MQNLWQCLFRHYFLVIFRNHILSNPQFPLNNSSGIYWTLSFLCKNFKLIFNCFCVKRSKEIEREEVFRRTACPTYAGSSDINFFKNRYVNVLPCMRFAVNLFYDNKTMRPELSYVEMKAPTTLTLVLYAYQCLFCPIFM